MFWIDLSDPFGNIIGPGPLTSGIKWRYTHRLSRSGEWSLEVPANDPRLVYATALNSLNCYTSLGHGKAWMGGGEIQKRVLNMHEGQAPTMVLSGNDLLYELASTTLKFELDAGSPYLGSGIYGQILNAARHLWLWNVTGTTPNLTARFVDESILNALTTITNKTGQMFRLSPPISFLGTLEPRFLLIFSTIEDSGIVATNMADPVAIERNPSACLITSIERQEDATKLINKVKPYGSGTGQSRFNIASATTWPDGTPVSLLYRANDALGREHGFLVDLVQNWIADVDSLITYGARDGQIQYKEITPVTNGPADMAAAANTLVGAAVQFLLNASIPQEHYAIGVAGLRQQVFPGQSIRVVARQMRDGLTPINIDQQLIIQEVTTELDATGAHTVGLTVSTTREFAQTDAQILVAQIQNQLSYQAHPQMGPSDPVICYREDIDGDHGATFPFWISNATTQVNSVVLRFKLEQLRSTVKSVGGTATGSVTLPNHQHPVTVSNHTHDVHVSSHSHDIPLDGDAASHGLARLVYFNPPDSHLYYDATGGPAVGVTSSSGGSSTPTSASNGGQTVTSGGGGSASVSLDLANAISAVYGIYEDPTTAYTVSDLDWALNLAVISTTPTAIGAGWYELDLTSLATDPITARPLASSNTLAVAVKSGSVVTHKNVRITAQIEIRKVIQSIAALPSTGAATASITSVGSPFTDTPSTATSNADTLDGFDSSSFVKVTDYDPADVLAKVIDVDGPGSGLDADTLDGLDSTALALASHTHASTDITDFTEAAQDVVGGMFVDSATIDFTYSDAGGTETAIVIDSSITFAKMQTLATDRLIGRDTAGTGAPESIALGVSLEFGGSGTIQRAALTGDVTAAANSNALAIATAAVTDAKLRNSGALSVIGRSANSSGAPADISVTPTSGAVLRESGSVLGFGTVDTAGLTASAVTNAKLSQMAQATVKGRAAAAGTGDPVDLTAAQLITILTAADGIGSLLDADFLDGLSSAAYGQLSVANVFTTEQAITPSSTGVNGLTVNMPASTAGVALVGRYNASDRLYVTFNASQTQINMNSDDLGNNITGPQLFVGRNTNATNASAGSIAFLRKGSGAFDYVWTDNTGVLRTNTSAPTGTTDTGGTVIGSQTSMAAAKNISEELPSLRVAFESVLKAAQNGLRAWGYKNGAYNNEYFPNGLVVDYAPRYGMDRTTEHPHGKSLNVPVAIGDLMASIAVLHERLNKLEGK